MLTEVLFSHYKPGITLICLSLAVLLNNYACLLGKLHYYEYDFKYLFNNMEKFYNVIWKKKETFVGHTICS